MPVFEYEGLDASEQPVRGTVVGSDLRAAADQLEKRGLKVSRLELAASGFEALDASPRPMEARNEAPSIVGPRSAWVTEVAGPLVGQVPLSDLMFFFRQLATLLNAGISPAQAFDTLSRQTKSAKLREILVETREQSTAGAPMSYSLQRYPEVFSPLILSLVRVGEETGDLDTVCDQIADYLEDDIELRNQMRRDLIYPKLLLAAAILIPLAANMILASVGGQPFITPLTTASTWFIIGPLLIGYFLFVRVGLKNPRIRRSFHEFIGYVPWVGKTVHGFAMAKFGRAFGALYKGGVPVHRAVALAVDATGNEYLRSKMVGVPARLESGVGIATALQETGVVDALVLDMVNTGETTGNLDQMLMKVSRYYQDECKTRAKQHITIFTVVVMLGVCIYMAIIIISAWSGYGASFKGAIE